MSSEAKISHDTEDVMTSFFTLPAFFTAFRRFLVPCTTSIQATA